MPALVNLTILTLTYFLKSLNGPTLIKSERTFKIKDKPQLETSELCLNCYFFLLKILARAQPFYRKTVRKSERQIIHKTFALISETEVT